MFSFLKFYYLLCWCFAFLLNSLTWLKCKDSYSQHFSVLGLFLPVRPWPWRSAQLLCQFHTFPQSATVTLADRFCGAAPAALTHFPGRGVESCTQPSSCQHLSNGVTSLWLQICCWSDWSAARLHANTHGCNTKSPGAGSKVENNSNRIYI